MFENDYIFENKYNEYSIDRLTCPVCEKNINKIPITTCEYCNAVYHNDHYQELYEQSSHQCLICEHELPKSQFDNLT